jgi:hypothetical protein
VRGDEHQQAGDQHRGGGVVVSGQYALPSACAWVQSSRRWPVGTTASASVGVAIPPGDLATLRSSRIIGGIGQLSCLPGLLSPFPGSDTPRRTTSLVLQDNSHPLNADKPHYVNLTARTSQRSSARSTAPPAGD